LAHLRRLRIQAFYFTRSFPLNIFSFHFHSSYYKLYAPIAKQSPEDKAAQRKKKIEKIKNSHIVLQVKLKEISRRDIVQWS